jgi:hypothetical protein
MKKILVIDVGGSNVKMMISQEEKRRKFPSGPQAWPGGSGREIKEATRDWEFEAISIGFPAPVRDGKILHDPKNLGKNWAGFDLCQGVANQVRITNDAALQALGQLSRWRADAFSLGRHWARLNALSAGSSSPARAWRSALLMTTSSSTWLGEVGLEDLGKKGMATRDRLAINLLKQAFIADYVTSAAATPS